MYKNISFCVFLRKLTKHAPPPHPPQGQGLGKAIYSPGKAKDSQASKGQSGKAKDSQAKQRTVSQAKQRTVVRQAKDSQASKGPFPRPARFSCVHTRDSLV